MNVSRPFIERPIATSLAMIALLLVGVAGYLLLPVSALPEVDYPTIQVYTRDPGASPEVIGSSITSPLERQLGQMSGLKSMRSTSSDGTSIITMQFDLALSLDVAEQEVQAAINASSSYLPANLPYPPVYSKVNPADAPVLRLSLTSNVLPLTKVEDLADTRLAQKISQISGVGLVTIDGGQRPAVRVQADMAALNALGLSLEDLRGALDKANVNQAKGSLDGSRQSYAIGADDQLTAAADYRDLIIAYRNGAPVRLSQIARSVDASENDEQAAWTNGTPSIVLDIRRQPGANVIAVVDRVRKLLPQLSANLPASVHLAVSTDRTATIRASIADVRLELATAVALVVMVIFVFLRNLPATVIPAVTVPLSLTGTLALAYAAGFSLNNLTLMALTVATGFVVDDAIVVIENVTRFVERGAAPLEAALNGARQIGFTIVSLSASLIAVMIPLLFMGDVVGRLFREFAVTLVLAIALSAFVSLTLTPMMCARLLKPGSQRHRDDWVDRINRGYLRALDTVLDHPRATLALVAATALLTLAMLAAMPKGFFPRQDTGSIEGVVLGPPGTSFVGMAVLHREVAARLARDPAVAGLSAFVGIDQTRPVLNQATLSIDLKDRRARDGIDAVMRRLARDGAGVAGARLFLHPVQDLTLDDSTAPSAYSLGVQSADAALLARWSGVLVDALRHDAAFANVQSMAMQRGSQVRLRFDRDTAARLGVTPQAIDDVLYDAFGQRQVSTLYTQVNQYHVVLVSGDRGADLAHLLSGLYVNTASGKLAPLAAMASMEVVPVPVRIDRQAQFPYADIGFDLPPHTSLGAAIAELERVKRRVGLPVSVQVSLEGSAALFQDSLSREALLVFAAVVVVYLVLGVLYESFVHPLTILSTLPSAAFGALLALFASGTPFDVMGLIGIVLLIGMVMKNAIMMIDFALAARREQGMSARDAIRSAAALRFRPILMTTMASLFGALPLAFGTGIGSELRHPLGVAIIGGLCVSQLLTLFSTPVIYLALQRVEARRGAVRPVERAR
ncbi:efflux RND transporter permease subunit [Burkholderia plantarii]|uniref:efflux RND transporter permease subunit n=1 Tax=Burkholderia plantarii TaxID=41899 RepID=UPI000870A00A|nr:efflux RND transporter permease subunit [Burkholderia plantarii]